MTKHTPERWRAKINEDVVWVYQGDDLLLSAMLPLGPDETLEETLQRGRLIARAPEMKELLEDLMACSLVEELSDIRSRARALLKEVEGDGSDH